MDRSARLFAGVALASLLIGTPAIAVEPGLSVGVGYEHLELPGTKFAAAKVSDAGRSRNSVAKIENHDGDFDGVRIDLSYGGIAVTSSVQAGIKGFYSWYDGGNTTRGCRNGSGDPGMLYCTVVPLVDPNVNEFNMPFFVAVQDVTFTADRDIDHWGAAIEFVSVNAGGGPQDAFIDTPTSWKGGIAYRAINQDLTVTSVASGDAVDPPGSVTYTEDLDTSYLGGYIGLIHSINTNGGVKLIMDAEVGFYWAQTDYDGVYNASNAQIPAGRFSQALSLSDDAFAVIAALKLSAEKDMGPFKLAGFVRGEYVTYAPEMAYNDQDRNLPDFPNTGINDGTSIDDGHAWTFSAGARVTVPFQQVP